MKSNVSVMLAPTAISATNTVNSAPIPIEQIYGFAVQAVFTGTATGTVKLQASCDPAPVPGAPEQDPNWTDIPSATIALSGSAGNGMINVNGAFYRAVRASYTNVSGSGTLSILISQKG